MEALKKIYSGPTESADEGADFPGTAAGNRSDAGRLGHVDRARQRPPARIQFAFGNSYYGAAVFEDPKWDFRTHGFRSRRALGDDKAGPMLNATNPDLRSFRARGGKLIQYHGWGDAAIAAPSSIEYYEACGRSCRSTGRANAGEPPIEDFYRLFMVPGMAHCGGGVGPNRFGNGAGAARPRPRARHLHRARALGRAGHRAGRVIGTGRAATIREDADTAAVPVSPGGALPRHRRVNDAASFACAAPAGSR